MNSRLRWILLTLVFVVALCGPALANQEGVSGDRALAHVEFLVEVAPRFAGTPGEAAAASYIENEFRSYGLDVWVENFIVENSYVVEENHLSVVQPAQIDLKCVPVVYSPSDNVLGQLIHLTDGVENENLLRERVVLVRRDKLDRELADLPPLAILTYFEDMLPWSEIWPNPPKAPMVWISDNDAQRLIELLGQGEVEVELKLTASTEPRTSYNVVACLPSENEEIIVVNAHHDSMLTPGAVDDASGVAIVLEMARVLSAENLQRTVLFVTFSGEELGLFGSADFVNRHKDNKIVASITFDCIGAGPDDGLRVGLEDSSQYETTMWLDAYVQEIAENMGFDGVQSEYIHTIGGYTDHASFTGADIPATWIYWVDPEREDLLGLIHTLGDNLDEIDKARLQQVAELGVEVVRQLAGEDIAAWRREFEFPIRAAIFTVIGMSAVVLSIGACSFIHYKRGWPWRKALRIFLTVVGITAAVAYALLLL
jgi:aminopeptidase YwaD